jgi:hypothetical protein
MGIRKIYTNEELEMEVTWSKNGIHLNINHFMLGELPPIEFTIEPSDIDEFKDDIEMFSSAVEEYIKKLKNK